MSAPIDFQEDQLTHRYLDLIACLGKKPEDSGEFMEDQMELVEDARRLIRELTGVKLRAIISAASQGASSLDPARSRLKEDIRHSIFKKIPYFSRFLPEAQMDGSRELGTQTNAMLYMLRNSCYPDDKRFEPLDNVASCGDPAQLLLLGFKDGNESSERGSSRRKRLKFEAFRQLLGMMHLAYAKGHQEKNLNHATALDEWWEFLEGSVLDPQSSDDLIEKYIVADFDELGKVLNFFTVDSLEDVDLKVPNRKIEPMPCRKTSNGDLFMSTARPKLDYMLALKAWDSKKDIASRAVDQNGVQLVFLDQQEWEKVFEEIRNKLRMDIVSNLQKRLELADSEDERGQINRRIESLQKAHFVKVFEKNRRTGEEELKGMYLSTSEGDEEVFTHPSKANDFFANFTVKAGERCGDQEFEKRADHIDDSIVIYQLKDAFNGGFEGSREVSSDELKVYKFKMEIRKSDGQVRHYEFQIFLPEGYMEAKYRKDVCWKAYNIKRSFRLMRALYPEEIYGVDHDEGEKLALKRLYDSFGFQKIDTGDSLAAE